MLLVRLVVFRVRLTIVYEDAAEGWIMASILEVRGVFSPGRTRAEAADDRSSWTIGAGV